MGVFGDWHLGTWIRDNLSEIRFHVNDSEDRLRYVTATPENINVGDWHMYTGVYEGGSTLRLMVDGRTIVRGSGETSTGRGPWDNFVIGSYTQSDSWNPIQGNMGEVRVYSHALTASEVHYLYNVSKKGSFASERKQP